MPWIDLEAIFLNRQASLVGREGEGRPCSRPFWACFAFRSGTKQIVRIFVIIIQFVPYEAYPSCKTSASHNLCGVDSARGVSGVHNELSFIDDTDIVILGVIGDD